MNVQRPIGSVILAAGMVIKLQSSQGIIKHTSQPLSALRQKDMTIPLAKAKPNSTFVQTERIERYTDGANKPPQVSTILPLLEARIIKLATAPACFSHIRYHARDSVTPTS